MTSVEVSVLQDDLISVVVPTYNYGHVITETIRSILSQTYKNIEVIVVDDGSTDDTESVVARIIENEPRVSYIKIQNSRSPVARNTGIHAAKGKYIAVIDADDLWPTNKLELQYEVLQQNPGSLVIGNIERFVIDENGNKQWKQKSALPARDGDYIHTLLSIDTYKVPCFNTFLADTEIIRNDGLWDPEFVTGHDWENWIRLAKKYNFIHLNETLYFYRKHSVSTTKTNSIYMALHHQLRVIELHTPKGLKHYLRKFNYRRLRYELALDSLVYQKEFYGALKVYLRAAVTSNIIFKKSGLRLLKKIIRGLARS